MVLTAAYREFLSAIATSAAAQTGLLFVAISAAPRRGPDASPAVIQQVRAAAALVAFFNALAVSLFGLGPGERQVSSCRAGHRRNLVYRRRDAIGLVQPVNDRPALGQFGLVVLLLLIFGTELAAGIALLADSRRSTPLRFISYALAASLLLGVARAWELVGARGTGIVASLAVLTCHAPSPARGRHSCCRRGRSQ